MRELDSIEPSPDVWDRALAGSREGPPADLQVGAHRRIVAGTVAALVAAAGVTVAFLTFREVGTAPGTGSVVTYRDPTGTWEIVYPDNFQQWSFPQLSQHPRFTIDGIWIANFDPPPPPEDARGPLDFQVPDDGVIVRVYQMFGGPFLVPRDPDATFPILFDDLKGFPGDLGSGVRRGDTVLANGEPYTITVEMGPDPGEDDRKAAADIVSSFRILPLEEGTAIGRHLTFYVLGPPERYPVGSVTRFDESSLPRSEPEDPFSLFPFYLVRVPRGFYALAWPDDVAGGYKDCAVTYEPTAQVFSCPNGAMWALDGSVIRKPQPDRPDDPLSVLLVRISLDGHVLVSPNIFMSDATTDLRVT